MKLSGKLHSFYRDIVTKKYIISFSVDSFDENQLQSYTNEDLCIDFDKPKRKRSLDANAYFHVLVGKLAESMTQSKIWMKNRLIAEYGQVDYIDGHTIPVTLDADIDAYKIDSMHLQPTEQFHTNSKGKTFRVYLIMRGSHTYDTKEMSKLIDGTVAEAKEAGIETLTPDQLERMKAEWQKRNQS